MKSKSIRKSVLPFIFLALWVPRASAVPSNPAAGPRYRIGTQRHLAAVNGTLRHHN